MGDAVVDLNVLAEDLANFVLELADREPGAVTFQAHQAAMRALELVPR